MLLHRIAVKIAFFINGFLFANWVSRLPRIQELYSADDGTIGVVLLASSMGAVGAMPFTGWVIIRNGSRRITLLAAFLYCMVIPFIALMPGIIALFILFFLMGIVTGMLDVAMNAQAILVEQEYKKSIITSFHALFSIGMMLGAGSAALFTEVGIDLTRHFLIVVCASLIAVGWMSRNLVHDKPAPSIKQEGPLFRLPNQSLISIGIITFCGMIGEGSVSDWSVNYMENIVGASKTLAPIGLSAFATSMTLGRIFGDKIRMLLGDRKMIIAGGLIAITGICLSIFFPVPYIVITGFFLVGLGLSSIVPIAYSIAGNVKELPPGVGLAMVTTVGYSGFLIGPPVIGFIADWQNLRVALCVIGVLFIIMTVLGFRYKSK
ncbi:MAG: MFS transporter [Marivirga sp.]|nr:MFS transporter [Marivirga sp.]